MNDLIKRLNIKAGVMEMGEKIAWGSDTSLMREAANALTRKDNIIAEQLQTIKALTVGVEEHTGKQGTTPVLTYIARLESEIEMLKINYELLSDDYKQLVIDLKRQANANQK